MSGFSVALPRVKAKRRKRRRLTVKELAAFVFFALGLCVTATEAVLFLLPDPLSGHLILAACTVLAALLTALPWPVIHNYIVNGWEDDQ